jgi:Trk-type K+ transport system membrane component
MDSLVVWLIVLGWLGYVGFKAYVFFYLPEVYEAEQKRKHELEKIKAEESKARAGKVLGVVANGIVQALLGGFLKNKHN